jgi:hypothetical protein
LSIVNIEDTIPEAERIVYDFTIISIGTSIGTLYDVLYDSLVEVIAGPDSATMIKEEEKFILKKVDQDIGVDNILHNWNSMSLLFLLL